MAAIFVENTMEAAKFNDQKVTVLRRKEYARISKKLEKLVLRFAKKGDRQYPEVHSTSISQFGPLDGSGRDFGG